MHAELPYVAFFAALLVLVPLPWHWRARNVATLAMVAWLFVANVIYGVDAVLWKGTVEKKAIVWCDITSRLIIGATIALPAACMCISIHLAQVASVTRVRNSTSDKRRRQIIELIVCFGVPMLWMALHLIVQGHRFDIIEDFGCRPNTYISIPAVFLIWVPPLIFSAVTIVFSLIALAHFLRHRITFARFLENSNSGLTTSRYLRLMAMAFAEIVLTAVSSSFTLWFTTLSLRPWTNWDDVHWNFSRIDQYPTILIAPMIQKYYYATWYLIPFSSLVFFVFFAFGQEAMREYAWCGAWLRKLACCAARKEKSSSKGSRPFMSLPSASFMGPKDTTASLPSYQSAVGDASPLPTPIEKELAAKEFGLPEFVRHDSDDFASFQQISDSDDEFSRYSHSVLPSPSHTDLTTPRHSISVPTDALEIYPPIHAHDAV